MKHDKIQSVIETLVISAGLFAILLGYFAALGAFISADASVLAR
jgi:hypothetical protein